MFFFGWKCGLWAAEEYFWQSISIQSKLGSKPYSSVQYCFYSPPPARLFIIFLTFLSVVLPWAWVMNPIDIPKWNNVKRGLCLLRWVWSLWSSSSLIDWTSSSRTEATFWATATNSCCVWPGPSWARPVSCCWTSPRRTSTPCESPEPHRTRSGVHRKQLFVAPTLNEAWNEPL